MAASQRFCFYLALLAVSFSARSTASRVLQQAPPLPIPMAPPSPGLPPVGAAPGQCAGVTFAPSTLGPVAANCTGPQLSQLACCSAISGLWEMAGIASPQAAQTLGTATIDFNTEQACLAVTQQALAPLGVTIDLRQLCAGPLGVLITPGNTCPSKDLPPAAAQNVMSACANVPT
ncbi:hypothetical protein KFL_000240330 [Klebsormidium nitens]|uniref:Bifunctional inhibitor/plant lipid transfer protein/seed storage helical domain-containing protein n=1 Tax=Klebsormidium nitens TaxID=105231 RepID=A0A1Y1HN07_KLENI|nr:hypothetical protein KFL_000240330 [Klebsormidium nitens]|eukprot:GAQ79102.1 hypothetical protein KFL_000240330 [Klebsormidium nitens]